MTLTKADIKQSIWSENEFVKNQATETVQTLFEIIKRTLESGEDVLISGFGKFCVKEKTERKGRNPATGEDMMLALRKVVTLLRGSPWRNPSKCAYSALDGMWFSVRGYY